MPKKAIQFMIISALSFTFLNVFVKQLLQFHVYQIVFFRSVGSVFFTMGFLLRYKIPVLGNQKKTFPPLTACLENTIFGGTRFSKYSCSFKKQRIMFVHELVRGLRYRTHTRFFVQKLYIFFF